MAKMKMDCDLEKFRQCFQVYRLLSWKTCQNSDYGLFLDSLDVSLLVFCKHFVSDEGS